jgi:hypothetical protein
MTLWRTDKETGSTSVCDLETELPWLAKYIGVSPEDLRATLTRGEVVTSHYALWKLEPL